MTKKQERIILITISALLYVPFIILSIDLKEILYIILSIPFWLISLIMYFVFKEKLIKENSKKKLFQNNLLWHQSMCMLPIFFMIFLLKYAFNIVSLVIFFAIFCAISFIYSIVFSLIVLFIVNANKT